MGWIKKTMITGATGGLGSSVLKSLLETTDASNIGVLIRQDKSDSIKNYQSKGLDVRIGDYEDLESLNNAFRDIKVLYFVSGSDIANRMAQHKNVVEAAKKAGIEHIVYTSTVRKDERNSAPLHVVVDAHRQTENWIKGSGIDYTILRHNLYAEVIPMFIGGKNQLLQTKSVYLPCGNGQVAFAPRKDLAQAAAIILSDPKSYTNRTLELNGSEKIGFSDVAKMLSEITQEPIQYISPGIAEFNGQMKKVGVPEPIIGMLSMFGEAISNGEFDQQTNDLETILGRRTQSLKDFLTEVY